MAAPVFVFDNMRTRSNLFHRWISTSPEVVPIHHPFSVAAFLGPERFTRAVRAPEEQRKEYEAMMAPFFVEETYEEGTGKFVDAVGEARDVGKIAFAKDHAIMTLKQDVMFPLIRGESRDFSQAKRNPTVIPDDLFGSLIPIIMIRHPCIQIESIVRQLNGAVGPDALEREFLRISVSNKPCRFLYDVFCSQGRAPLVIEGDDVLWRTDEVAKAVCDHIGIGIDGLTETWQPYAEHERPNKNPYFYMWMKTAWDSTELQRPIEKPGEPDEEAMYRGWIQRYGKEMAAAMESFALANLEDYEYLYSRKV